MPSVTKSNRNNIMFFAWLAALGGFSKSLDLMFMKFSQYFTGNLLKAAIVEKMYVKKRNS
jgi:hypothetical protein